MVKFLFVVNDDRLRSAIIEGIVPHLDIQHVGFHLRGREVMPSAELTIVCVSGLGGGVELRALQEAHERGGRVALIARTEDRAMWNQLAATHRRIPFVLVIAVGGPRERYNSYFPGALIASDMTSLVEPGKQLARLLLKVSPLRASTDA